MNYKLSFTYCSEELEQYENWRYFDDYIFLPCLRWFLSILIILFDTSRDGSKVLFLVTEDFSQPKGYYFQHTTNYIQLYKSKMLVVDLAYLEI